MNSGNQVVGYDMIAAIDQATLNMQLSLLWPMLDDDHRIMKWEFKTEEPDIGLELSYSFEGSMNPPQVILGTSQAPNFQVKLCVNIDDGILTYGSTKTKSVKISNWKYVFDVNLNFVAIKQDRLKSHAAVPNVVKKMLESFTDDQFSIRHLLLNFEDANIANYDGVHSELPLPKDTSPGIIAFFQTGLTNYFKDLAKTDHPYILGYSVESRSPSSDPSISPTFTPTKGTYWIFHEPDQAREDLSALNFLMTTAGHSLPATTDPGFKANWITSKEHDGRFVVAAGTFFDSFILPKLLKALDHKAYAAISFGPTPDIGKSSNIKVSKWPNAVNWKKAEAPSTGHPHWKYSFNDSESWITQDGDMIITYINVQHTLANDYSITIDLENKVASRAVIKLKGTFKTRHDLTAHPLGIEENMWTTTELDWGASITLEGGTHGIVKLTPSIEIDNVKSDKGGNWIGMWDMPFNQDLLSGMAKDINDGFQNILNEFPNFLGNVNNRFVLPAGGVFALANPQFDSYQNLLLNVTYKTQK